MVNIVTGTLPFGLSFAGGAMMYVVFAEMIPESHSYSTSATLMMILEFALVLALDFTVSS